jgi:hypothetical protein
MLWSSEVHNLSQCCGCCCDGIWHGFIYLLLRMRIVASLQTNRMRARFSRSVDIFARRIIVLRNRSSPSLSTSPDDHVGRHHLGCTPFSSLGHIFSPFMVAVTTPIHRVVTCFILSSSNRIAIFHRCATMPYFPNHFAGISGTIEPNETPHQAAQRELFEETNLIETVEEQGGLFVNVPYASPRTQQKRIIRVYPFVIHVSDNVPLEMRGTEHDA